MTNDELTDKIIEKILSKRPHQNSFHELIAGFEQKLDEIDFTRAPISVEAYFGVGVGKSGACKRLLNERKIYENILSIKEKDSSRYFKGIYFFVHETTPFYVGISRRVLQRIGQHVKGHDINTSSLAYRIAKIRYALQHNAQATETKTKEWFSEYVKDAQRFLLQQKVVFLPIANDEEMYLFEVFCSMKLGTSLNLFETH